LEKRNPRPAYQKTLENELVLKETDLDLFTYLNEISLRHAFVNIPEYKRISPKQLHNNQKVISEENRHGELVGVISNQKAHSFSARIIDYNVVETLPDGSENIGVPRNFAVVDYDGNMRNCWNLQVKPNQKETDFVENKRLSADGMHLDFHYFVHPNRAFSFYGSPYIATHILSSRIQEEANFYRALGNVVWKNGARFKKQGHISPAKPFEVPVQTEDNKIYKKVENLEAIALFPEPSGQYPILGIDNEGDITETPSHDEILEYCAERSRTLSYSYGPRLNATKRAVEFAFFKNGFYSKDRKYGNEIKPSWEIPEWDKKFVPPGRKTEYNALHLNDKVTLAYRIKRTSVKTVI